MKGKSILALMEQLVMLAVFALCAALCLQGFVKSDRLSRRSEAQDRAMVEVQSVAEAIKNHGGEPEEAIAAAIQRLGGNIPSGIVYNEDWTRAQPEEGTGGLAFDMTDGKSRYTLLAYPVDCDIPGLAKAGICLVDEMAGEKDREIVRMEIAWQTEVREDG